MKLRRLAGLLLVLASAFSVDARAAIVRLAVTGGASLEAAATSFESSSLRLKGLPDSRRPARQARVKAPAPTSRDPRILVSALPDDALRRGLLSDGQVVSVHARDGCRRLPPGRSPPL